MIPVKYDKSERLCSMGNSFEVRGWTYTDEDGWHYRELYMGESLFMALCVALRARRHYGCVKMEMRQ